MTVQHAQKGTSSYLWEPRHWIYGPLWKQERKNRGRTNCYSQLHQNQQPAFKEFSSAFYLITYLMGYETLYKSQHFL